MTIALGINDHLPQSQCWYVSDNNNQGDPLQDSNPALNYTYLPLSCKLANWLGMLVISAAGLVLVAIWLRYEKKRLERDTSQGVSSNVATAYMVETSHINSSFSKQEMRRLDSRHQATAAGVSEYDSLHPM